MIIVARLVVGRALPQSMQSCRHQASSGSERAGQEKNQEQGQLIYAREKDCAPFSLTILDREIC